VVKLTDIRYSSHGCVILESLLPTSLALVSIGHAHPIDLAVNRFKSNKSRGEQPLLDIAVSLSKQIYRQFKHIV